ncbi:ATP-binding protein [Flavobacterium sp. K5-23]|uniref:sensor histidine kinase n=1 Tax=Flavobacterium sp. K5-23 TaxID=2746225 RepID=UPI00200BC10E|nr:HAMP domain-containing sensor histidine kinase [Flavobacterium sp. K5-23]UQD55260.1 HAMP domain-containing histidine kinase [Flavobacterium sp. K5-23]
MLEDKIQSEALNLKLYLDRLSRNESVIEALKSNNRLQLQEISESYKKTHLDLKPDLLNFISDKGILIYRNHLPNQFGENISQLDVFKKASNSGTSFFHIGSGTYSNVTLKVVIPVRDAAQKVVGYVVVGKNFNKILEETSKQTHMDFLFFSKKNGFNINFDKDKTEKFGLFIKGKDTLLLDWSTLPSKTKFDKGLIEEKIKLDSITTLKLNGIDYFSKSLSLLNFDKKEYGRVFVLHDNSIHLDDLKRTIFYLILISVLMISILSFIFNNILNKVGKNLFDKNQKLVLELKKRIIVDKKLVENNNELTQLTLIASHDLRSPLTNLEGLLCHMKEENIDPDLNSEMIGYACASVDLMKTTIDSLTTVIKQKESLTKEAKIEQNIEPVFNDVILQLNYLIDKKDIEVKADFSECPTFLISVIHLKSILQNILSNAVKYASDNPDIIKHIEISTHLDKGIRSILIKDNGIGFDSGFQKENLFKPFKRYHHENAGTGIGLYLTKLIVENHNGTIKIESNIGKGTTVKIEF